MLYFDEHDEGRIQAETMEVVVALICQISSKNQNYKRIKEHVDRLIHRHEILFTGMLRKLDSLSIKINKDEKNRQDIIDDLLCHDLTTIFNYLIQNDNISWGKIITILAFSTFIARKHNEISDRIAHVTGQYIVKRLTIWIKDHGGWINYNNMSDKLAFQFKMQTKMLERQAISHDKQEKIERDKVKKALMKGNIEAGKIHAENAIRHHSESLNCKRMAARVDGVQARVANSAAQRQMAASLKQTVALMSKVTANMPLTETSKLMDSLEKNFEDLEVKTKVMDDAMQNATSVQQPVDQVANLMQEMADEAGIELNLNIPSAPSTVAAAARTEQDELTQRLAKLRES
ncbi:unnamed protein product [Rotaria sordida]|uniref:Bcl-2 Bcl-2 homology region 1-3 domain-containing protein n=1 Tax=Rotaria sordida TaxID=392033 RepID=A0A818YHW1_9BILA|nr:unnamed protein product [Rotaria sordida]CAF0987073.1 unnamed protein product [Rotaria sordida]CAF0991153.1 unnamed protein product [Rotaria sordida]CAF3750236.1 unnamed protein product [Rotaria sordida]CAF3822674.1 unnamed protein product [Rotaria sordida]